MSTTTRERDLRRLGPLRRVAAPNSGATDTERTKAQATIAEVEARLRGSAPPYTPENPGPSSDRRPGFRPGPMPRNPHADPRWGASMNSGAGSPFHDPFDPSNGTRPPPPPPPRPDDRDAFFRFWEDAARGDGRARAAADYDSRVRTQRARVEQCPAWWVNEELRRLHEMKIPWSISENDGYFPDLRERLIRQQVIRDDGMPAHLRILAGMYEAPTIGLHGPQVGPDMTGLRAELRKALAEVAQGFLSKGYEDWMTDWVKRNAAAEKGESAKAEG